MQLTPQKGSYSIQLFAKKVVGIKKEKMIDTDKRTNEHASEYERNNRILSCCKNFFSRSP